MKTVTRVRPRSKLTMNVCLCVCVCVPLCYAYVPAGSPSRGGDVVVHIFDVNQPTLPTPFYSLLESISVFMALSTVFHSINSPDNSPLSDSVLPVLYFCLIGPYI